MSRAIAVTLAAACLALVGAVPAAAEFGFEEVEMGFEGQAGTPPTQAGSHPDAMVSRVFFETFVDAEGRTLPDGQLRNLRTELPVGLVGEPGAVPRCSGADFADIGVSPAPPVPNCSDSSAVGFIGIRALQKPEPGQPAPLAYLPVYNLEPAPGSVAKLGFAVLRVPVTIDLRVEERPAHRVIATLRNSSQALHVFGAELTIWGSPADPVHDPLRGTCLDSNKSSEEGGLVSLGNCPASIANRPFLTLPRSCEGPMESFFAAESWALPVKRDEGSPLDPPSPTGCAKIGFKPSIVAQPTTKAAQSPTGLDFSLAIDDQGLTNPSGLANSDIRKAVVTLPQGMTVNPSIAEGLEVCSETQLARESAFSAPGEGCPQASKIGAVEVETPLLEEQVNGSLYVAEPYDNPFDSLIALYIVIKNPRLGIKVVQSLEVRPDPVTGRLTTIAEELPQLPFSSFRLRFREGARSPLVSPPACGVHEVSATLYPWAGGPPLTSTSAFQIVSGPDSGPCPAGGLPPFKPGLLAGTLNNAAGQFSPFNLRLSRSDSEQEFTRFSIKLPPGIAGILAGIPYCSEAGIARAKARTGPRGGREELADPSCPAASEIGRTLAGAGVGPALAYAPGKIYLAGPYNGSALSMVAITAGVVGPFDIGTVVVRQAFQVDRETAEVFIDSTGSDPIPHIIKGIPVHARDIRAYVDRQRFVFNPTSCERTSTASTLLGSGLDFGSAHDDNPVTVSTPFQAADCAALEFRPRLGLRLLGGVKRGDHPRLRAVLRLDGGPEGSEANTARARVTLPRSAFLDQSHIRTVCTRVQFREDKCPPGSVYGHARAFTPVLAEPLKGPVYLRSSSNRLPDLVASLHHEKITVDVVGRIDSLKGRIRNTFEAVPDAPVTKFVLTMQGGHKGLIVNSANLCRGRHRAISEFGAQNGKVFNNRPRVRAKCGKRARAQRHSRQRQR